MQERSHIIVLTDFMTGLNEMRDASSQLVHQFQNPKFMAVRDMLNMVQDVMSKKIAMNTVQS